MNVSVEALFLHLTRCAIEDAVVDSHLIESLTESEWSELFDMVKRQGVTAMTYRVISPFITKLSIPKSVKINWALNAEAIMHKFNRQVNVATELSGLWAQNSIETFALKGIAFSEVYSIPSERECGDFDCYLLDNYTHGEDVIKSLGIIPDEGWYKHSQFVYKGVLVENHSYLVPIRKNKQYKELNQWFMELLKTTHKHTYQDSCLCIPSPMFNVCFFVYHSFGHFISEGINYRHICDWAYMLKMWQHDIDWDVFYEWCDKYRFRRFIDALTSIVVKHVGILINHPSIVTDSMYDDKVLYSLLYDKSSIYNTTQSRWRQRYMVIINIFRYRWKYKLIYQKSTVKYLYDIVLGYLLKRENH